MVFFSATTAEPASGSVDFVFEIPFCLGADIAVDLNLEDAVLPPPGTLAVEDDLAAEVDVRVDDAVEAAVDAVAVRDAETDLDADVGLFVNREAAVGAVESGFLVGDLAAADVMVVGVVSFAFGAG